VKNFLTGSGHLRTEGSHAPSTVERRISTWRSMCKWRYVERPFTFAEVSRTLRSAVRASSTKKRRKSHKVVDVSLMEERLDHLDWQVLKPVAPAEGQASQMRAKRDRARLAVIFSSGGRRRSEMSNLMFGQVLVLDPIATESEDWPGGIPSAGLVLGRTKTTDTRDAASVFMIGRCVAALEDWIRAAGI
jgi:site-specific recombinase XerD